LRERDRRVRVGVYFVKVEEWLAFGSADRRFGPSLREFFELREGTVPLGRSCVVLGRFLGPVDLV